MSTTSSTTGTGTSTTTVTATSASASGGSWLQFQGGATHSGVAPSGQPVPPLRVAWKWKKPKDERVLSGPVVDGDLVIAVARHCVYGIDLSTGDLRWQLPRDDGPVAMPAVAIVGGHHILLFSEGGTADDSRLSAYDLSASPPTRLWQVQLRDVSSSGLSVDGATAFLGDRSGTVYAVTVTATESPGLRAEADAFAWTRPLASGGIVDAPPAVAGGTVFAVERNGSSGQVEVFALDEEDHGKPVWTFSPSAPPSFGSPLAIATDGDTRYVYVGLGDQTIRALRADDGTTLWSTRVNSPFYPFSAPVAAQGDVFALATAPGAEGGLYRLDGDDGTRKWWFDFDGSTFYSSPLVVGPYIYVALDDGRLAAVSTAEDVERWVRGTGRGGLRPMAVAGDLLLVSKAGPLGGILAFRHDPNGHLINVVSPTRLNLGRSLANFAIAFAAVAVGAFVLYQGVRRLRRGGTSPETADEAAT